MCKVGVRCSGHVSKRLDAKKSNLNGKYDALATLKFELAGAKTMKKRKSLERKIATLRSSVKGLKTEIRHIQREYDGTPEGHKKLQEAYLKADSVERRLIADRLSKGASGRNWLKNHAEVERKPGGLKAHRSVFLGLGEGTFSDESFPEDLKISA